jgi:hypothetical protein
VTLTDPSCTATTDSSGNASCQITPTGPLALDPVTASYAGTSSFTPSTASNLFEAGGVGLSPSAPAPGSGPQGTPGPSGTPGTPPTVGSTSPTTPSGPAPTAQPASLCGIVTVDLLDVYASRAKLQLLGYANPRLAGQRVNIKALATATVVAHTKVASDGYFRASAPLPPARLRNSNRTRYQAIIAKAKSPPLKLARRTYVFTATTATGGQVRITGQLIKPLASPPAPIRVARRDSCQQAYHTLHATVHLNKKTGTFTILAPAPPANAPGAVYRLQTRVPRTPHSHQTSTTFSLPRVINH